jgi:hypothetical protein
MTSRLYTFAIAAAFRYTKSMVLYITERPVRKAIAPLPPSDKASGRLLSRRRENRRGLRGFSILQGWVVGLIFFVMCLGEGRAIDAGMPNPPASPTVVKVGVFLADILDLNEVNETFQAELIVMAEWVDPRLAFDPAVDGTERKLFQGPFQFNEVFSGWWPQLLIINEIGSGDINAITIEVYPDGRVRHLEQRHVTLETPMNLQTFPFDTQKLVAKMIAFGSDSGQVILEVNEQLLGATEEHVLDDNLVNIAQWSLLKLDMAVRLSNQRYYGKSKPISELLFTIILQRDSTSVVWKVILPLIILVLLMWAIFWMEVDNLSDRLSVAFIGILTIVAYQFLIEGSMPRISYFTLTDTVLLYSFLVMSLTVLESLVLTSMCKAGYKAGAERVDHVARWAFPLIYFAGLTVIYLYYMTRYQVDFWRGIA